jgi:hypothetical protein
MNQPTNLRLKLSHLQQELYAKRRSHKCHTLLTGLYNLKRKTGKEMIEKDDSAAHHMIM